MPKQPSQDELSKIVSAAQGGSLEAFQELYDLFAKAIFNFIWRLVGSSEEAEDLTQDTFIKVHTELEKLRDPAQFKYWVYRIARNAVYQRFRRSQKVVTVSIDDDEVGYHEILPTEDSANDPERRFLSKELNDVIQNALKQMSPKYRDVFVLAVFQKLTYEAITQVVGRSLLSVKTDIYRARLTVKQHLNEYLKRKQ